MDTENTIRRMLEEGRVSEQRVQRILENFRTVAANPRYTREEMNDWYSFSRDNVLADVGDDGGTITAANLKVLAVIGAIDAMQQHYGKTWAADRYLNNGEGVSIPGAVGDDPLNEAFPGLAGHSCRWVRITENKHGRSRARNLATIYLISNPPEAPRDYQEMSIARARKGLPPNPYDTFPIRYKQLDGRPVKSSAKANLPDPQGSQGVKSVRATQRVRIEPKEDHDHMWHFPGFKVRSSKLLPVLTGFRDLGKQYIELSEIQTVIQRMA